MRLRITHDTVYDYQPMVQSAQHIAYLMPRQDASQQLNAFELEVDPTPDVCRPSTDVFGNTCHYLSVQAPHRHLHVQARSDVWTQPGTLPAHTLPWEAARDLFKPGSGTAFDPAATFIFASPLVPLHAEFALFAQSSFPPGQAVMSGALDLMHRIHRDFAYESNSTQVNTPALHVLAQRKGVCQDFAHVLIACLRSIGLAARYVSGYLLTVPAPGFERLRGCDASHAWASVYLPGHPGLWLDLDPTNDRAGTPAPGEDYVTLAIGRDFSDVSPLRGVIHGGAHHTLTVGVTVELADAPL